MVVNETMSDDDAALVWRRSISTMFVLVAPGFAFFTLSAARMLVDKVVAFRYAALFVAVSMLLVGSAGCSWFGRWWLTAGLVAASMVVFVLGIPDR